MGGGGCIEERGRRGRDLSQLPVPLQVRQTAQILERLFGEEAVDVWVGGQETQTQQHRCRVHDVLGWWDTFSVPFFLLLATSPLWFL